MSEQPKSGESQPPTSHLDPAKGGRARAESLTPEERREIASKAADARWKVPQATHLGNLDIAGQTIECAVLEDGRRILGQQSVMVAIGKAGRPNRAVMGDGSCFVPPPFLAAENLKPFIDKDLQAACNTVVYRTLSGQRAFGYEARILPLVCNVYLAARTAGVLTHRQIHISQACEMLVRALAQTGIVALVDEATGYQEVRDRRALQAILDRYLRQEFAAWAKRFPDEFYQEIFRLRGWEWRGMKVNRPQCVARYTKELVYVRLAPRILQELEKRNPTDDGGYRKARHHQFLTEDVGHPALAQHLYGVIGLMRVASNWDELVRMVDKAYPRKDGDYPLFKDFDGEPSSAPPPP
jgi:hypothetical protein